MTGTHKATVFLCSCVPALATAAFVMTAAWDHNSQGEIHVDGVINWSYWLMIGFSWFVPVFAISFLLGILMTHQWNTKNE